MKTLTIVITGLCAFVTDKPPTADTSHVFRASLVNAFDHVATVIINEDYLVHPISNRCEEIVWNDNIETDKTFYRCDIDEGETVTFEPIGGNCWTQSCLDRLGTTVGCSGCLTLENSFSPGARPICPDEDNANDVYWLGKMAHMVHGNGSIKRLAHWRPRKVPALVHSQAVFPDGQLLIADFLRTESERKILPLHFGSDQLDHVQAVADLVVIKKLFASPQAPAIRFWHKAGNGWTYDDVKLQGIRILVELKNLPESDLCEDSPDEGEFHYRYLFGLLETTYTFKGVGAVNECPDGPKEPESILKQLCDRRGARLNDPQCPGGFFSPGG